MRPRNNRLFPGRADDEGARAPVDPEGIRALAAILVESGLTEIEISDKDYKIRIARTPSPAAAAAPSPALVAPIPPPASASMTAAAAVIAEGSSADPDAAHPGAVLSPMVGVVYLSPEPGAPSFITVGQTVAAGQTLVLIEAMKTFNQIKAPKAGTVSRILVSTGAPVEYGEPLVILD